MFRKFCSGTHVICNDNVETEVSQTQKLNWTCQRLTYFTKMLVFPIKFPRGVTKEWNNAEFQEKVTQHCYFMGDANKKDMSGEPLV